MSEIRTAILEVRGRPDVYRETDGSYRVDIPAQYLTRAELAEWSERLTLDTDGRNYSLMLTEDDLK